MKKLSCVFSFCVLFSSLSCEKNLEEKSTLTQQAAPLSLSQNNKKPMKIAIVGDSGREKNFKSVLQLIKSENVDLALHLGDLAYDEKNPNAPEMWDQRVSAVLGEKFPYIFLIGNHDVGHWYQSEALNYSEILDRRLQDNPDIVCSGEGGIKSHCTFRELFFVMSGIGTYGNGHEEFIESSFSHAEKYSWRMCAWHKNQTDMQTGYKHNSVGWTAYKTCAKHGAMIATAHEHSYARTKNLKAIGHHAKAHGQYGNGKDLELDFGKTFVFVNGLGGSSLRPYNCEYRRQHTWWATVFASNYLIQDGEVKYDDCAASSGSRKAKPGGPTQYNYGALFIDFHYKGDPKLAKARFKTIDGVVIDSFTIRTQL